MLEIYIGLAISLLPAIVGVYYLHRAIITLQTTTPAFEMLPPERRFLRSQGWRRLVNSVLMLLLAAMWAGWFASGLHARADALATERQNQRANGSPPPLTDEQKQMSRLYAGYIIAMLILLSVVLLVAGADMLATRRYGLRQLRQIQLDRRAMLQRQLNRWREERGQEPS